MKNLVGANRLIKGTSLKRKMLAKIKFVVKKSKFVKLDRRRLNNFVLKMDVPKIYVSDYFSDCKLENYEEVLNLIFSFSCINFAFWGFSVHNRISRRSETAMQIMKKIFLGRREKYTGAFLQDLTLSELWRAFNKRLGAFLMGERWNNLREAGVILSLKFGNSYLNVLKEAKFDAEKILTLTSKYFPSFDDRTLYKGKEIQFHKRAQSLISMIANIYKNFYRLTNLASLTGFADYRIPQLLRHLGILKYAKDLGEKIDNYELITAESEQEIEIRAFTIWAIELIKNEINKLYNMNFLSWEIDNYLWNLSRKKLNEMLPHHRTLTIYY